MDTKSSLPAFSEADIRKVLGTAEGQALLRLLNKDGGALLKKAAQAVKQGDMKTAQELVRPVMESKDAEALIKKINGNRP